MVDCIAPATTAADIAYGQELSGTHDAAPVMYGPSWQWAVEDNFVGGVRSDLAAAGAELVADVIAHEHMKLRMLNGTHSSLAYTGYLDGYETIVDTMAVLLPAMVRDHARCCGPARCVGCGLRGCTVRSLCQPGDPASHVANRDGWQPKNCPLRKLGTLSANLDAGRTSPCLCTAIVAWMRYVGGLDEASAPIEVKDPLAARLAALSASAGTSAEIVAALIGVSEVFPALAQRLKSPVCVAA